MSLLALQTNIWAQIKVNFKVSITEGLYLIGMMVSTWLVNGTLFPHFCLPIFSIPSLKTKGNKKNYIQLVERSGWIFR